MFLSKIIFDLYRCKKFVFELFEIESWRSNEHRSNENSWNSSNKKPFKVSNVLTHFQLESSFKSDLTIQNTEAHAYSITKWSSVKF